MDHRRKLEPAFLVSSDLPDVRTVGFLGPVVIGARLSDIGWDQSPPKTEPPLAWFRLVSVKE